MGRIMVVMAACLLAAGLLAAKAVAQPVYKCTVGGKVSYGEHPCASGTGSTLAVPPPPADAAAAAEKLERDKARLAQLEKSRQAQAALDERDSQRAARAAASLRQKCERLRLKAKWADEDLAQVGRNPGREAANAARLKAKRQAEALAVECPA